MLCGVSGFGMSREKAPTVGFRVQALGFRVT